MEPDTLTWRYTLRRLSEIPDEMEEVPAGGYPLYMPGLDQLETESTAAFLMDRQPVMNREFKLFLDEGGYRREEFWREPAHDGVRALTWQELIARCTDAVGAAGPAHWEMGDFAAGEADHPVAGVCWFEAAAYAAWAGKTPPTIFHWNRVAMPHSTALIAPLANLSGRGTVPVGSTQSENRYGVHDLAGNVREWVFEMNEFTAICPFSDFPDFGTIRLKYRPNKLCVELKSLKLYINSFRNVKVFHEHVVNIILEDLVAACDPLEVEIEGDYNVRGNIKTVVRASYKKGR